MEKEYIRIDKKQLTVRQIKSFFDSKDFKDNGNDLFTNDQLSMAINNFKLTFEFPAFSATQNEYGIVEFKTGKLLQFIDAVLVADFSPFILRKLQGVASLTFYVAVTDYNKEWTKKELLEVLSFYL